MQQIGWGDSHTLILQTNPTSRTRAFYEKRGFQRSPGHNLESLPLVTEQTFHNRDIHFVSKESQVEDGTEATHILVLLYQQECLFTKKVESDMVNVDETTDNLLFRYPFDSEGSFLEQIVIPEEDWLFAHPAFKPVC